MLDELRALRPELVRGNEHRGRGNEAAHGDIGFVDDAPELARIQRHDLIDRELVLPQRLLLVLVVIEVGAGQDADRVGLACDHVGDRVSDLLAHVVTRHAETHRNEREVVAEELLEKWELNFEGMFACVCARVIGEQLRLRHQRGCQSGVDRDVAERCAPRAVSIDRGEVSVAGVIRTEDDESLRQLREAVKRRGDVTAVHQSRVRDDRADEMLLRCGLRIFRETSVDLRAEALWIQLVERSRNRGRTRHHPYLGKLGE